MALRLVFQTVLVTCAIALAHPYNPPKPGFSWNETNHVIAFGDSYTYVQGTHGLQNYSFIGDYLDFGFSGAELLENQIVQNQTSTAEGGPNWIEYLTNCGVKPGLTSSFSCKKQLWDFAFAGADISLEYTAQHHNWTVPFVNQTTQFLTYANPTLHPLLSPLHTLVVVWIGINDIGDTSTWKNITSFPTFYSTLLTTEFAAVETLYAAGYRNFLFMNLPPLDKTPGNVIKGPEKALPNATMVGDWNELLAEHIEAFALSHQQNTTSTSATGTKQGGEEKEVTTFLVDVNTYLNGILDAPADYGIKNSTGYCASYDQLGIDTDPAAFGCLPLEDYFWFNTGHLTSHIHKLLAGEVERVLLGGG